MTTLTDEDLASIAITALDVANSRAVFLNNVSNVKLNNKQILEHADEINTWILEKVKKGRS